MGFIFIMLFAFAAGLLGGMGMGGGTILIPALTLFLGIGQHAAQAANLPAVALSAGGAFLAAFTPADLLRRMFGAFLVALAIKQAFDLRMLFKAKKSR